MAEDTSQPLPDALTIKDAGEGAAKAKNPFDSLYLQSYATEEEFATANPQPAAASSGTTTDLISKAKSYVGTPYKWGGSGPLGFDCSGFTQYVYKSFGIELPRVSYQQATYGKRVGLDQLRPGDLVAWDNSSRNNGADHIAIYIGNGQVIHAPKPGDSVKISPLFDKGRAWGVAMNL